MAPQIAMLGGKLDAGGEDGDVWRGEEFRLGKLRGSPRAPAEANEELEPLVGGKQLGQERACAFHMLVLFAVRFQQDG